MKRLSFALAAILLVIAAVLPQAASAGVTNWSNISCTSAWHTLGDPVPFVCLSEDAGHSGDKLTLTGSSDVTNLGNLTHTPAGLCNPKLPGDTDNWNDCFSSAWMKLGGYDSFCMYGNSNFNNLDYSWWAPNTAGTYTYYLDNLLLYGDQTSSLMLQQSGTDCNEGGV